MHIHYEHYDCGWHIQEIVDAGRNVHGAGKTCHSTQKRGDDFAPGELGGVKACSSLVRSIHKSDCQSSVV